MVLDTNAVLDWLVFVDAGMAAAGAALKAQGLRWLACSAMREELVHTLSSPALARWKPNSEHVLSTFDQHAEMMPAPASAPPPLRCSDPDDQVFFDLALGQGARWLLTRDRALLRLAKRSRALGLCIVPPQRWQAQPPQE